MQNSKLILLVEDDFVNVVAIEKAFKRLGIAQPLIHARDGEQALEYLRDDSNEKPSIILLDLYMPNMDGIEFLKIMKTDSSLRDIPVIMLTTSQEQQDIAECFSLNAAGYMIKPLNDDELSETIKTIMQYWNRSKLSNQQETHEQLTVKSQTGLK